MIRLSFGSDYADLYVEFRPGSDLALANGVLHVLLRDGKIQRSFIRENLVFKRGIEDLKEIGWGCYGENAERYTFKDRARDSSFDELKRFLDDYTPQKVSEISGVVESPTDALWTDLQLALVVIAWGSLCVFILWP